MLTLVAIAENLGYRQLSNLWRIRGWWQFLRGKKGVGRHDTEGIPANMTDDPARLRPEDIRARLASLRAAYAERAQAEAASLVILLDELTTGPAALESIRQIAHNIRGTAGTLGFPDASADAGAVEDAIDQWADHRRVRELALQLTQTLEKLGGSQLS